MGGGDIINYLSAEAEAPSKEKRRKCNIGPRKTISSLPPFGFSSPAERTAEGKEMWTGFAADAFARRAFSHMANGK